MSIKNRFWNQDKKEFLIVFAVMTFIMLPVRFLFVELVSDDWFGSFGLISIIAIAMIVLVKKGKLGRFGQMFENQMIKIHKGKRRKIVYGNVTFAIFVTALLIYSINAGDTTYLEQKQEVIEKAGGAEKLEEDFSSIDEMWSKITPEQILLAFIAIPYLLIAEFPYFASLWAIENDLTNGFLLHFSTVFFVEEIEFVGVLIFYKITLRKKNEQTENFESYKSLLGVKK